MTTQNTTTKESKKRQYTGVVTSDKMDKTIVVRVDTVKKHAQYIKQYVSSKKYKVHDEKEEASQGDHVVFEDCRPLSRDKRWRLVRILK